MTIPEQNKAHVALFVPSLRGGGAERVMLELANGFAERGVSTDLVLVKAEGPYLSQVSVKVRLVDLGAKRTLYALPGLIRYLQRERPLALLSTMGHTNQIALLARGISGVKLRVVTRESMFLSEGVKQEQGHFDKVKHAVQKRLFSRADGIVAPSEAVAQSITAKFGFPRERLEVIYNPVVSPHLQCQASKAVTHPWFAEGQPPVVLAAGRLTVVKDYPTLIEAFGRVRNQTRSRLVILGEGEERANLEALVRSLGLEEEVAFLGFVANPFAYMKRAAAFVLPSLFEGLPNVLIQALAVGTPAIATDCPGGSAEILEGGRFGALVPVGDSEAMARAILESLSRPPARVDDAWLQKFSAEAIIQQYLGTLGVTAKGV